MGDVLDQLLTQIIKGHAVAMAKVVVDTPGNADFATLDEPLEPSSYVHSVAENIVVLDHDVADIDADPEAHPASSGSPSFAL